jgi:predicted nucleic acid-binding protein
MKALLDTCVIIDVLQNRQPFCEDGKNIFLSAANNLFTGCISAKSTTDIYYLTHHCTHSDKQSREILTKLFSLFEVVDTAAIDCKKAIPSNVCDYEDAVMIETAVRIQADCIVTRNLQDFSKSTVPVYSPKEFLDKLQQSVNNSQ